MRSDTGRKRFYRSPAAVILAVALAGYVLFGYGPLLYIPVPLDRITPSSTYFLTGYLSYVTLVPGPSGENPASGAATDGVDAGNGLSETKGEAAPSGPRIRLQYLRPDRISRVSRELSRDGGRVTVIYYYHAEFFASYFINGFPPGRDYTLTASLDLAVREPGEEAGPAEVYYLIADFDALRERGDAAYDEERQKGRLVWSGML